jgi:heat shock protein HtpX
MTRWQYLDVSSGDTIFNNSYTKPNEGAKLMKRIGLFLLTNILVITTITIVLNLLGVDGYMTQYGIDYTSLAIICGVWGMGGSFISLMMSKWMAKMMMGVQIIDEHNPQFSGLVNTVHRLAKQAGINKMPEVGVYQSPEINAFATGPSKNNSLVAVSTGLLNGMNQDEIEGVLAHEVAHVANGDMVTMTLIQGVINAFVMFAARIVAFAINNAVRSNDDEGEGLGMFAHFMVVMVLQTVFMIFGSMVVAWFSRYREFRADSGGASLAGRGKMVAALERLKANYGTIESGKANTNDAITSMQISSKRSWLSLFSSHPPLEERIHALQRGA